VTGLGQIRGTVVDGDTGRPLPDFEVGYEPGRSGGGVRFMFRAGPRAMPGAPHPPHAEGGAVGSDDAPAGASGVTVSAHGCQKARSGGVTVPEGGAVEGVEVRLRRGGAISGRVLEDRTGRPVVAATVRAELATGGPGLMRFGPETESVPTTDAD